jgi:hypothetical protein
MVCFFLLPILIFIYRLEVSAVKFNGQFCWRHFINSMSVIHET